MLSVDSMLWHATGQHLTDFQTSIQDVDTPVDDATTDVFKMKSTSAGDQVVPAARLDANSVPFARLSATTGAPTSS